MKEIPITSFRNLKIGQAENTAAGTGCTVFLLGQDGAPAGLDVRGGGPASRESELLKPLAAAQVIHAIVLAGGSAFGLDAAGGVMRYLEERGIGFDVGVTKVPLVCQSDLFDLTVADAHTRPDGRKSNTVTDSKYTGENLHNISELYLEQQHKTLSEAVVELWSNSKAHADNMTSARYGEIGVGLARGIDKDGFDCWYCVQVFLLDGCEVTRVDTPANK